jgi:hypothetical protein
MWRFRGRRARRQERDVGLWLSKNFLAWKWRLLPSSRIGFIWESAVFGVGDDLFIRAVERVDAVDTGKQRRKKK